MRSTGELTATIGNRLEEWLKPRGYEVYYDHGPAKDNVGEIVSWFVDAPKRRTRLSVLDIAVVEQATGRVRFLIEIEETNDRPKNLLGDVFGALMGAQITFRKKLVKIGPWTNLIVFGIGSKSHHKRNEFLGRKVKAVQSVLGTRNALIRNISIKSFEKEEDLESELRKNIEDGLKLKSGIP
jgi:hypothetical protein